MKSDAELRQEFRERHRRIAQRTVRFLFCLPALIAAVMYTLQHPGFASSVMLGLLITTVMVWAVRTHERLTCPKCSSPQTTRGFSLDIKNLRCCVVCGFELLPEIPVKEASHPSLYQHKVRWGFTLLVVLCGASVCLLGYLDHLEQGMQTGLIIAAFGVLPHFGFFNAFRTCPKCHNVNENFGHHCGQCGEKLN